MGRAFLCGVTSSVVCGCSKSLTYILTDGTHDTARNYISMPQTDQQDPLWITGIKMNILFAVQEEKGEVTWKSLNLVCASRTLNRPNLAYCCYAKLDKRFGAYSNVFPQNCLSPGRSSAKYSYRRSSGSASVFCGCCVVGITKCEMLSVIQFRKSWTAGQKSSSLLWWRSRRQRTIIIAIYFLCGVLFGRKFSQFCWLTAQWWWWVGERNCQPFICGSNGLPACLNVDVHGRSQNTMIGLVTGSIRRRSWRARRAIVALQLVLAPKSGITGHNGDVWCSSGYGAPHGV